MSEKYHPEAGDIIIGGFGTPESEHRYKVYGVHMGALKQEDLVEIESISHEAGWTGQWEYHPRMFVPLWMLQGITVMRPRKEAT